MTKSKKTAIKEHASLFWEFFKIGLFTIGGGMAMLPLIQKVAVEDKKWMDAEGDRKSTRLNSSHLRI